MHNFTEPNVDFCIPRVQQEVSDSFYLAHNLGQIGLALSVLEIYLLRYFLGLFYDISRLKLGLDTLWYLLGNYM